MTTDNIIEVGINTDGQLYLKPYKEKFPLIWRSASEVHWNDKEHHLYSPKPREWSYLDWYKHIVTIVKDEYGCELVITGHTSWSDIPDDLKGDICLFNSGFDRPL
ncbi:hypothetical protein [Mucilaginibacter pocheonensis]|uniref:Integron Cassette Protein Hfx-Cass5 domain-containing protein n=1 Tax=Mucilaginibacter pocheonensis TaxID=398050 RepID=A0ABU1T9L0_9SPHI|nr:hypothetical protein [Mucilaginibacter pocheonensis]MDR6942087.1 hypothetical protein [Mucilaginibacter pocheonensis]